MTTEEFKNLKLGDTIQRGYTGKIAPGEPYIVVGARTSMIAAVNVASIGESDCNEWYLDKRPSELTLAEKITNAIGGGPNRETAIATINQILSEHKGMI
jgi:hypothetical protein